MRILRVCNGGETSGVLRYLVDGGRFAADGVGVVVGSAVVINAVQLLLSDAGDGRVVGVAGESWSPGWQRMRLVPPKATAGGLCLVPGFVLRAGELFQLNDRFWPVRYDPKTGWIRFGYGYPWGDHEAVQFLPYAIAVFQGETLRALWLHADLAAMPVRLLQYEAIVWSTKGEMPGRRISFWAEDEDQAKSEVRARFGSDAMIWVWSDEDRSNPR